MSFRSESAPQAIGRWAEVQPDKVFVQEAEGQHRSLTYAAAIDAAHTWAGAFTRLGVRRGDAVATILPSGIEAVSCWMGLAWLRAYDTGIHHDYRGTAMRRLFDTARPVVVVTHADFAEAIAEVIETCESVRAVVVVGHSDVMWPSRIAVNTLAQFLDGATPLADPTAPERHDVACVVFTSGTTGPSKAVLVPWGNFWSTLPVWSDLTPDDAFYSPFPLCHAAGRSPLTWIGVAGGTWVVRTSFRTDSFWEDITRYQCTTTQLLPVMATWLLQHATDEQLKNCPLRKVVTAPLTDSVVELQRRLDLRMRTVYGMSEIGMAVHRFYEPGDATESCGTITPGYEMRLVDELDYDVPLGEVGEAIVRTESPWGLNLGYLNMPAESALAWRNGWFHTGDGLRQNADGTYEFVDRLKDALRRRGENVSSFELESVVQTHPAVAECAVIGVGDSRSDQEIKLCIVLRPEQQLDPAALVDFLEPQLPRFMLPRYVEFFDSLPRTDVTNRVKKHLLRQDALSATTWDRLAS